MAFPTDLEIARGATLTPLVEVGAAMGLGPHLLEPYGEYVMKVKTAAIEELARAPRAKYVVVTGVTPTPLGEGKTTHDRGAGPGLRAHRQAGWARSSVAPPPRVAAMVAGLLRMTRGSLPRS